MNPASSLFMLPLQQPVEIFLVVLVIILATPLVFRWLKIPYIVGMIIAGVAVGPHGFHLLEHDASFRIFGQVGILYLMFLAAVEIDMFHLRQNYRHGVGFGLLTFAVPMIAGVAVFRIFMGASWPASVLIASMFASHTLISYPIVTRFGLSNSRAVVVAVCGTIVTVLLALVVLAEVVAVVATGGFSWILTLRLFLWTILYAVAIGLGFPWLTRRFLRLSSDSVTQFIFILAMVFLASMAAQLIGLEAILGAFYAGLVLNRFIPSRSTLMSRIEFVGNAIFIPYFLIGVGMLIDVGVIFHGWGVVKMAAVMTGCALLSKWIAAWSCTPLFQFSGLERRIVFGLSSGKAAATLAATMVGFQYGILDPDMMNGAVLMILVCCAVASISTERAAMRMRMKLTAEDLKRDTEPQRRNARQLVAVSNPITAEGIMRLAIYMRHPSNRLPIVTLYVRRSDDETSVAMGRNALRSATDMATSVDLKVRDVERFDNNIVNGIVSAVREFGSSDIILGMHRRSNIVDTFYGSMIEQLLRSTNKMVIMSRCFVPVDTVARLYVVVPRKAEYETGFRRWVERVGNLASQLGCRVLFMAYPATVPYIQGVLTVEQYNISHEYLEMDSWDDFITLSNRISDEDLMIVIGARRASISYGSDLENLPSFLGRYFTRHNLLVVYPEQFGSNEEMPAPIDPLATSVDDGPRTLPDLIAALFHPRPK